MNTIIKKSFIYSLSALTLVSSFAAVPALANPFAHVAGTQGQGVGTQLPTGPGAGGNNPGGQGTGGQGGGQTAGGFGGGHGPGGFDGHGPGGQMAFGGHGFGGRGFGHGGFGPRFVGGIVVNPVAVECSTVRQPIIDSFGIIVGYRYVSAC